MEKGRRLGRPQARASYITQCRVRVTDQSPYKSAGYAQADGKQYCSVAVTWHEIYTTLLKFYNGAQYQMKVVHGGPKSGNHYVYASARYWCTATPRRTWEARADGYAMMNGVLYGGSYALRNDLSCG